jgi:hypothetical protein
MFSNALELVARKEDDIAPPLDIDTQRVRVTIYMGFVSFMILIWDHITTFDDEVEYIWKGRKGVVSTLFFLNRYLSPFGFIINLFAYLSLSWTVERCQHFVRYEGSMTVIGINTTALMMLMRISALYHRQPKVVGFVAAFFLVELGVNAWLLTHGTAVVHQRQIHACTMIFDDSVPGWVASSSAWLPLSYDTVVLALTLRKTIGPIRRKTAGKIARVLLRDGILYYSVIFSVNLVLVIMIAAAPAGLQNITAQLEYLLTVAMMSRITLHLRKQVRGRESDDALFSYKFPSAMSRSRNATQPPVLRFARSTVAGEITTGDVSVMIQESAIMHDDHGNVIRTYDDDSDDTLDTMDIVRDTANQEWYELKSATLPKMREPPEVHFC